MFLILTKCEPTWQSIQDYLGINIWDPAAYKLMSNASLTPNLLVVVNKLALQLPACLVTDHQSSLRGICYNFK
jgi:hypothetical protein